MGAATLQREQPTTEEQAKRTSALGVLAGLAVGLCSGVLATLALEPYHIPFLMWVAFVPAIVAQHRLLPRRLSGLAIGLAVGGMFQGYLGPGLYEGDVAWYLKIYGVWVALIVWAIAARSRSFQERTGYRWFILSAPVAWVALDLLRSNMTEVFGGTWGYPAYALYDQTSFIQPVSVFGIHALNLLLLIVNWAIAAALIAAIDRRREEPGPRMAWPKARLGLALGGIAIVAWGVLGVVLMDDPPATVRVAAVQHGPVDGDQDARREEILRRDFEQTRLAAANGAKLVVWREGGLRFDPRRERTEELRALAAETGAYLAIGWGETDDQGRRRNEATVLTPEGKFLGSYGKQHPGTFAGDYSDVRGSFPTYETPFGRIATIICFDLDFTDSARGWARRGARLIAVPSNDLTPIAETHYTHLVFRAIENRLPMVKADSAFDSAIIDPYGRILEKIVTPHEGRGTLVADVPLGSGRSLAVTLGDWVGWLCVAGMVAFVVLGLVSRRRARVV